MLQRDVVDFHNNIIRFYGITQLGMKFIKIRYLILNNNNNNMTTSLFIHFLGSKINQIKNYVLVMEYADGNTLRKYLKKHFKDLTWKDKYKLAYQLSNAVLCLHDEGIVHHDLVNIILINWYCEFLG